ncbi:MAG: GyrI-like domain-containing protein [Thermoplasmata archaeon]|nr:GyrI-like domain-containing protein [Thermoplasmata archaeon]
MERLDVRIVHMESQRLAYAHEFGTEMGVHERAASKKIRTWARERKLLDGPRGYHYFGANDPPPMKEGDRYGYFSGVTVPPDTKPEGDIKVRELPASFYAVVRFKGLENIGRMWHALYTWVQKSSDWSVAGHGLEEVLAPSDTLIIDEHPETMVFDLWLPVVKKP